MDIDRCLVNKHNFIQNNMIVLGIKLKLTTRTLTKLHNKLHTRKYCKVLINNYICHLHFNIDQRDRPPFWRKIENNGF